MTDQLVTLRITTDARGVVTGATTARGAIKGIGQEAESTGARASRAIDGIVRQARNLAAAYVSVRGVMTLGRIADEYTTITGKLRLITAGTNGLAIAQRTVFKIAQETSAELGATATLYARLTTALSDYGASSATVANITRTVNQAMRVSGATGAEAASAILQLSQAFASGRLAGEEFNAINEAAPRLMAALARSMGVPRGALKELAAEGKITSEVLMRAFTGEEATRIANEAAQIPLTFGAAFTKLQNALTKYVGELDQTYGISAKLAQLIADLADNFDGAVDSVMQLAQAVAVLAGARALGALIPALTAVKAALTSTFAIAAAGAAWQGLGVAAGTAAVSIRGLSLAGDAMGKGLLALAGGPVVVATGALALLALKVKETWDAISEAEQRGQQSIQRASGSIGQGFAGASRPRENIEADVTRLSGLMQRDRGREQALNRHRESLARLQQQYLATGATVEQWNAMLDRSAQAAKEARDASSKQGAALKAIDEIAKSAGLNSAKLAEENRKHAEALRLLAIEEAKGGEAAKRAAIVRQELNAAHKRTVEQLTGVTQATQAAARAQSQADSADERRARSMDRLREMMERARGATSQIADLNSRYAATIFDIVEASERAIEAGNDHADVMRMVAAIVAEEGEALTDSVRAIEAQVRERQRLADVVGGSVEAMEQDARLLGLSARERAIQVAMLNAERQAREAVNAGVRTSVDLTAEEVEAIRRRAGAAFDASELASQSAAAAAQYEGDWLRSVDSVSRAFGDWIANGARSFKDFGRSLVSIAKQWFAELATIFARRLILNIGVNGSSSPGLLGGVGGGLGGLGGSGAGGLVGGLIGSAGALLGGTGTAFGTGLLASGSIFSGAGLLGGITGSIGAGIASISGGAIMQGIGMLAGPIGAIVGAVSLLASVFKKDKPPDFRVGGSSSNVRKPEGGFETVFGDVRAGSRRISWESLVEPIQKFDDGIQALVNTMGGGQQQLDAISAALSRWSVDLKGDAATAENVLGSRLTAILGTFSENVQQFVGNVGTVEDRIGKLADALSIERFAASGELLDSFDELADVLTSNRAGTEALADTYARVLGSTRLLESALALSGQSLDLTRAQFVNFAADITEAAGGLDQAAALWEGYFSRFYSDGERQAFALTQAQASASNALGAIGLDPTQFVGGEGMARFRQLFEEALPNLSAEAVVQWLNAGNALANVVELTGTYNEALGGTIDTLTSLDELMGSVDEQIAGYGSSVETYASRLSLIGKDIEALVSRAEALGASEEQIARIRELGQLRVNEILEQQRAAFAEYSSFVSQFQPDQGAGLSEFQRSLRDIAEQANRAADEANRLAIAAGMAGAASEDLAAIQSRSAEQAAAAAQRLEDSIRSLADQLGYTATQAGEAAEVQSTLGLMYRIAAQSAGTAALDPQRYSAALQIAGQLRELSEFAGDSIQATMDRLQIPLDRLLGDFGIQVDALSNSEVFDRLVQASRVLGVEVTEAAERLGVNVGDLSDATSQINDAFERTIGRMPESVRSTIQPLLEALEGAGSPEARAAARSALVDAVDALPPGLRAALAPFLDEIDTTAVAEQQLSQIEQSNRYLSTANDHLLAIRNALSQPVPAGKLPGEKSTLGDQQRVLTELQRIRDGIDSLTGEIIRMGNRSITGMNAGKVGA